MTSKAHPHSWRLSHRSPLLFLVLGFSLLLGGCDIFGAPTPSAATSPSSTKLATASSTPTLTPSLPGVLVYTALQDGTVTAIDVGNGVLRWQHNIGVGRSSDTGLLLANQTLYISNSDVSALRASDGSLLWSYLQDAGVIVQDSGVLYIVGFNLNALNASSGKQLWQVQRAVNGVTVSDGQVYLSSPYTSISAVSASTGQERWHFPQQPAFVTWIGLDNGTIYLLSDDGAPQPNGVPTLNVLWRTPIPNTTLTSAHLLNGIIAAGTTAGDIETFSTSQGTPLWTEQLGQSSTQAPDLTFLNGALYAQHNGLLFAFNPSTGAIIWQLALSGPTAPPMLG